jgi:hypothetical protein
MVHSKSAVPLHISDQADFHGNYVVATRVKEVLMRPIAVNVHNKPTQLALNTLHEQLIMHHQCLSLLERPRSPSLFKLKPAPLIR